MHDWATDAVWPEHLLDVTRLALGPGDRPGEKLVVQDVTLDAMSSTPAVTLRNLYASDYRAPFGFVERLNALEVLGERPYEATQRTWTKLGDGQKFAGKVDVRIGLRKLTDFREGAPQRQKERKNRLKKLGGPSSRSRFLVVCF